MPAARTRSIPLSHLGHVFELRENLKKFVTKGPLSDQYNELHNRILLEPVHPKVKFISESFTDWFIYEWVDDDGDTSIDHFIMAQKDLSEKDFKVLDGWFDSINSVFEIKKATPDHLLVHDLDIDEDFKVILRQFEGATEFKAKQFIAARLLPLRNDFIFSGPIFFISNREGAQDHLNMLKAFDTIDPGEMAGEAQEEVCNAFCDLFGCKELTVPAGELINVIQRLYKYVLTEHKVPGTERTLAQEYKETYGSELPVPNFPQVQLDLEGVDEVTILCDEFDGLVVLPDFNKFKRVFKTDDPDKEIPEWRNLVWNYVKNSDIPIVAFERVAEKYPKRVEKVMQKLLDDKSFSLEHLYAAILHFKEPVEGFEDLEDEELLWDLLNGNTSTKLAVPVTKKKTPSKAISAKAAQKSIPKKTTTPAKSVAKTSTRKPGPLKAAAAKSKNAPGKKAPAAKRKG